MPLLSLKTLKDPNTTIIADFPSADGLLVKPWPVYATALVKEGIRPQSVRFVEHSLEVLGWATLANTYSRIARFWTYEQYRSMFTDNEWYGVGRYIDAELELLSKNA